MRGNIFRISKMNKMYASVVNFLLTFIQSERRMLLIFFVL